MTIGSIASLLFNIAKTIPKIMEVFEKLSELVMANRLRKISKDSDRRRETANTILKAIEKAETNEDRIHLARIMYDYTNGRMPDDKLE